MWEPRIHNYFHYLLKNYQIQYINFESTWFSIICHLRAVPLPTILCTSNILWTENNMKSSIFWNIMPHSPLKVFLLPASCWLLPWLILWLWKRRQHVPLKCRPTFDRLHGTIYQKTELFITTTVRTSNPTWKYYIRDEICRTQYGVFTTQYYEALQFQF
jgi:hypothetical protein